MSSRSLAHRKLFLFLTDSRRFRAGLTTSSSKKSRVLENLAAGSVNLTKEEFDEINQLVEGLSVYGLRYNQSAEGHLWG
jgi:hypothetical protein